MNGNAKRGFAAGAVLGGVAGALVVLALGGGPPRRAAQAATPAPAPTTRPVAAAPTPRPTAASRPAADAPPPADPGDAEALRACRQALADVEARAGKAGQQLHDTTWKLAEAKAVQAEDEGTPVKPPPGTPGRFRDPKYARKQVQALFDGAGGGEITSVDCTEFPCFVYGAVSRNDQGVLNQANMALQKAALETDGWEPCDRAMFVDPHDTGPTIHYAYAVCPRGMSKDLTKAQRQRLGWRMNQMIEADTGQ